MIAGGPIKSDPRAPGTKARHPDASRESEHSSTAEALSRYAEYKELPDDEDRISLTDYIDGLNRASLERYLSRRDPRSRFSRPPVPS